MRIIIIGAGPCGLGAAYALEQAGFKNYIVLERNHYVGGLSSSFTDPYHFVWDFAIHVLHSHFPRLNKLLSELLPDAFYTHTRKSWIREYDTYIPYPFQYNIHRLPPPVRDECLEGLKNKPTKNHPASFHDWILQGMGEGIARHFLLPYNRKLWTVDPKEMGIQWLDERVPATDLDRVEHNIADNKDDVSWGPNASFQFPKQGGTGHIWQAIANSLPPDRIVMDADVTAIDSKNKTLTVNHTHEYQYDALISTIPLPELTQKANLAKLHTLTRQLRHSCVRVVCLGLNTPIPDHLREKTWLYCPEDGQAFYRVTPFSILSPNHVPNESSQCSLMCEVSFQQNESIPPQQQTEQHVINSLIENGIIEAKLLDASHHITHLFSKYGYPIPTINRDTLLAAINPALEQQHIYSRGRFGAWKYEYGNMDHSFMQGVEVAERIIKSTPETMITPS